jgi:thiamine-phosphate pyrophosphorylase
LFSEDAMSDGDLPPCRLYLTVPAGITVAQLESALDGGDIGCVRLDSADEALRDAVHARDIACFSTGEPATGFDGVQIDTLAPYAAVRGRAGMVGVVASTRHDAMEAAEAGADYVALTNLDLVTWWAEMMEVPCVAEGAETLDAVTAHAAAGADFVAAGALVWNSGQPPRDAVAAINAAIAAAGRR